MMKYYSVCLVNKSTGIIEQIAVSDLPLSDEMVGKPSGYKDTHILNKFEFDSESKVRAKEVLAEIEMKGKSVKEKLTLASIKSKTGILKNIK